MRDSLTVKNGKAEPLWVVNQGVESEQGRIAAVTGGLED